MIEIIIDIIVLILAWNLFYRVIKSGTPGTRKIKATLLVILFSFLIIRVVHDFTAATSRFFFKKDGEVELIYSPFKMPASQNATYCQQFTDQYGKPVDIVSARDDGNYCGDFWRFKSKKIIYLPYRHQDATHTIYWASPSLQMIVTKHKE